MKNQIEGFYGGKFLPMHKGHLYCIDTAAKQCDHVLIAMFVNGDEELRAACGSTDPLLSIDARIKQLQRVCGAYDNVDCVVIDVSQCKNEDGTENWDAETPLVRYYVPKMDFVYSSEPAYGAYFARAYPEATHVIVDAERKKYPISGTMIRAMKSLEEREQWIV